MIDFSTVNDASIYFLFLVILPGVLFSICIVIIIIFWRRGKTSSDKQFTNNTNNDVRPHRLGEHESE